MSIATDLGLSNLPECAGWEFGGFPYTLEPLTLPDPDSPDIEDAAADAAIDEESYGCVTDYIQMLGQGRVALDAIERCDEADELYWFRWITGHQFCFAMWRLMAQVSEEAAEAGEAGLPLEQLNARLATYVRGYCIMLLYSGSCPRRVYENVIRPSMRLQHRSFTGGWASDYWPLRRLFRSSPAKLADLPDAAELMRSLELHRVVHDGIAAKLVPDGKSLLRNSSNRRQDKRVLHMIYDNYFMTLRAPVSRREVVAQLLRRAVAIAQDVAVNDLHREPKAELAERPVELHAVEVMECEAEFGAILHEVAACAANIAINDPTLGVGMGR